MLPSQQEAVQEGGPRRRAQVPIPENKAFYKKPVNEHIDMDELKQDRKDKMGSSYSRLNANMVRMKSKMNSRT